mgnify:CR=1 FL=1|tara:strand:- start:62 stop:241 length:180 start_codon:yes stop_codon:yes gene_type:complete
MSEMPEMPKITDFIQKPPENSPIGGRKRRRSKKAKGKKRKSSKRVKSRKIGKKSRKRRR